MLAVVSPAQERHRRGSPGRRPASTSCWPTATPPTRPSCPDRRPPSTQADRVPSRRRRGARPGASARGRGLPQSPWWPTPPRPCLSALEQGPPEPGPGQGPRQHHRDPLSRRSGGDAAAALAEANWLGRWSSSAVSKPWPARGGARLPRGGRAARLAGLVDAILPGPRPRHPGPGRHVRSAGGVVRPRLRPVAWLSGPRASPLRLDLWDEILPPLPKPLPAPPVTSVPLVGLNYIKKPRPAPPRRRPRPPRIPVPPSPLGPDCEYPNGSHPEPERPAATAPAVRPPVRLRALLLRPPPPAALAEALRVTRESLAALAAAAGSIPPEAASPVPRRSGGGAEVCPGGSSTSSSDLLHVGLGLAPARVGRIRRSRRRVSRLPAPAPIVVSAPGPTRDPLPRPAVDLTAPSPRTSCRPNRSR